MDRCSLGDMAVNHLAKSTLTSLEILSSLKVTTTQSFAKFYFLTNGIFNNKNYIY